MHTFTRRADVIDGNAGNDRIFGLAGDDRLNGGPGNDRVFGGSGNDTILGVQGNDWLNGGPGNDAISGDANDTGDRTSFDRIFGAGGDDTLRGGDSRDRIFGGAGNDTFHTRDGEVDRIVCGPGDDTALLDQVDVILDASAANPNGSCERVVRKAPRPRDSRSEDAQQSPRDEHVGS